MRRSFAAAALSLAVVMISALAGAPGFAQPALTLPGGGLKPPPLPPIKPYQTIAVKPPAPFDDPAFVAFRKQLAAIAANKDRAGLGHLIVEQNFFWIQDHDLADKHKAGIDNLAKAINLDAKDGSGWDVVAGYANEPTAAAVPQQKGVVCAPADPIIDADAFAALGKSTGTEPSEWGYPTNGGIDVHAASQPSSPVIEKLGMVLIRVLPELDPADQSRRAVSPAHRDAVGQIRLCRRPAVVATRRRRDVLHQRCKRLENCRISRRRLAMNDHLAVAREGSHGY